MRGKVIKKVISMFLILVMMCALTGCGGSSITGTWYLTEVHSGEDIYNMDELAEIFDAAEDAEISVMLELKNGEFRLLEKESDDKNSEPVVLLSGTYEENNGEYSFVIKGQEDVKENEVTGVLEEGRLILENKNDSGDIRMILKK
ncbi:MAG: hypothetical protein SO181_07600 [Frisingicoccus sp.]|uniref:hypothetical protein n=1 Tax=Frisingicoccus sp. TaxID=1918627 RepID=UPI002A815BD2|nr:hypothetical protein [Frisingicoccus sp.]MDY4834988.1 hypothetical protein [Frisingicoccus sp.]